MPFLEANRTREGLAQNTPATDRLKLVGSVVDGRYLVEAAVGVGGFGVVYRARHIRFDSTVALKVLFPYDGNPSPNPVSPVQEGTQEGRLQFQLAALHPSFVRVFETGLVVCGETMTVPYLAMEWLDGVTLKVCLDNLITSKRRLALETTLHLFDDLAQALAIAHARRVAHRDLKPSNIYLVANDGQIVPKLLDFGVAKVGTTGTDVYDDTLQKTSAFTPAYAAPEQWDRSFGATGPWTDVYAFALVIVELIVGRRWYPEDEEPQFGRRTLDALNRPTPRSLGLNVTDAVEAVFVQALALAPRERYSDMLAFWSALCSAAKFQRPHTPLRHDALGLTLPDGSIPPSTFGETNAPLSLYRKREPTEFLEESPSNPSISSASDERLPNENRVSKRFWGTWSTLTTVMAGVVLLAVITFQIGKRPKIANSTTIPSGTAYFTRALPTSSSPLGISVSGPEVLEQQCPVNTLATPTSVPPTTRATKRVRVSPHASPRNESRQQIVTTDADLPLLPEFASRGAPLPTTEHSKKHTFARDLILDDSLSTRK